MLPVAHQSRLPLTSSADESTHLANYLTSVAWTCALVTVAILIAQTIYAVKNDRWWGAESKIYFRGLLNVTAADGSWDPANSACVHDEPHCLAAFLLYMGPWIASILTALWCGTPTTWTISRHDGPTHLGL